MDIARTLREEISRRGLTATDISREVGLPLSTVSGFLRGAQEIGTDKASKIAEYLGFTLIISQIRRKSMEAYLNTVKELEERGVNTDDDTVMAVNYLAKHYPEGWTDQDADLAATFVSDLKSLKEKGWQDWSTHDADLARDFLANLEWLANNGWHSWSAEDANLVAEFVGNLTWLLEHDYKDWGEEDIRDVATFADNLAYIEERGESLDEDRMKEVAEFVANLEQMDDE